MRRGTVLLVATTMLLCVVGVTEAIEPYLEFREELNLSEQQISDMESILSSLRKAEIRIEADLRIAEVELDELLRGEKVDLSDVKSKLEEIAKLQANQKFLHIKAKEETKEILTEEQLKKFRSLKGLEWERRERIHRGIERGIEARMRELEERQREMLERVENREERMMRELKEVHRRIERDLEARMKELKERQEEMLERVKKREGL